MAVAYRSSSSANSGSTPSSSFSINLPSGAVANDVMIIGIGFSDGSPGTVSAAPSGWTHVINVAGSSNMNLALYWHLVTGYENASITFTFTFACQASGVIVDYSGAYNFIPTASGSGSTGTASTTTSVGAPNTTYISGQTVQFFGAYNTTASSTMTANGGYTQRADTCTTASQFVEVCAQDVAKTGAMGGVSTNAATISQSATSAACTIFLEAQRPAFSSIAQDESVTGGWTSGTPTSLSTALFNTNFPNELILAFINLQVGSTTVSSMAGGGLTWVNVGRANTEAGSCELWRTFASTPVSISSITASFSGATASGTYVITGFVGVDMTGTNGSGAIGTFLTGTSSSAAPTLSVTTTRNNSWVWASSNDPSHDTSFTVSAGQTLLRQYGDATNLCSSAVSQQSAVTLVSGTSVTMNYTAPTVDSCNILGVEILRATHLNLGSQGVG